MEVRCIVDCKNLVGESPLWHREKESLYWTDINGFQIQRLLPATGEVKAWRFKEPVCALSLTNVARVVPCCARFEIDSVVPRKR